MVVAAAGASAVPAHFQSVAWGATMPRRRLRAQDIAKDIKSEMIYAHVLEKYTLTPVEFRAVFKRLLEAGFVEHKDLKGSLPKNARGDASGEVLFDWNNRRFERENLEFALPIYVLDYPHIKGRVVNLSKGGVGTRGCKASVGELKRLVIPSNEAILSDRIEFEAICRWSRRQYGDEEYIGGFEALGFYLGSLEELLTQILSLSVEMRLSITRTRRTMEP